MSGSDSMMGRVAGGATVSFGGGPPRHPWPARWRARLAAAARALHRVLGAPDYEAYLAHHTRCHPGAPPLPYGDFVRRRQEERYARPGSRCC